MLTVLSSINSKLYKVLRAIIMFLLPAMSIMVFSQVVARYLGKPLAWSEELSTYFFSWLTYLGGAVVYYNGGHVAVGSFVNAIPNRLVQKVIIVFGHLFILIFVWMAGYLSSTMVALFFANEQTAVNIPFLRMGVVFLQVPIANISIGLFAVEKIIKELMQKEENILETVVIKEGGAK